jgi:hypothetical protein
MVQRGKVARNEAQRDAGLARLASGRRISSPKTRAETEVLVPAGPKIAVTGGLDFNDHHLIWDKLDRVHAKHPDMALLHGGSPKGRRTHRRQMGRPPEGAADRFQARLDQARQGRTVQTQRRDAGGAADRGRGVSGHGDSGLPG